MGHFLSGVTASIHPDDEMFLNAFRGLKSADLARSIYFRQGFEIHDTISQIGTWKFGQLANVSKYLEFACGYGRSTRFLVREVDPQNVWVSDIYADAVAFQKLTFGVNGFVSVTNPDELEGETGFDMIFVASLFTHLPGPRFEAWLRRLFSMLSPEGILAFSVHDEALAAGKNIPESGILFSPESESQSLGKAEYGTNIVTEAYVSGAIRKAAGPRWKYHRGRSVLCGAHDVYVISRDGEETFSNFNYQLRPIGYLDGFLKDDDGSIRLFGWAGEPTSGIELEEVRVYIDNELVAATKTTQPRPDVVLALGQPKFSHSGWEIRLSSTHGYKDIAMVEVIAASQNGGSTVLHFSPIGVALKSSRAT